jgi:hypothetical protein
MRTIFQNKLGGIAQPNPAWHNNQNRSILSKVVAGPGINIQQIGENIAISATGGWGTAGNTIPVVKTLPAIPTGRSAGHQVVFWASAETLTDATGDDQVWETWGGEAEWYPQWKYTDRSGVPV